MAFHIVVQEEEVTCFRPKWNGSEIIFKVVFIFIISWNLNYGRPAYIVNTSYNPRQVLTAFQGAFLHYIGSSPVQ